MVLVMNEIKVNIDKRVAKFLTRHKASLPFVVNACIF